MKDDLKDFFVYIATVSVAYFSPIMGVFAALVSISVVDHAFGIWKAKKNHEKIQFWYGTISSISKASLYIGLVIAVYFIDKTIGNDLVQYFFKLKFDFAITKIVGIALFIYEFRSVNKHFKEVKGVGIFSALFGSLNNIRKIVDEVSKIKKTITVLVLLVVVSCSVQKRATYHLNKAISLNPSIIQTKTDTFVKIIPAQTKFIFAVDSIIVDIPGLFINATSKNDSLTLYYWLAPCPEVIIDKSTVFNVPKSNSDKRRESKQKRLETKLKSKENIKENQSTTKVKIKEIKAKAKVSKHICKKESKTKSLFWLGCLVGFLSCFLLCFLGRKLFFS